MIGMHNLRQSVLHSYIRFPEIEVEGSSRIASKFYFNKIYSIFSSPPPLNLQFIAQIKSFYRSKEKIYEIKHKENITYQKK